MGEIITISGPRGIGKSAIINRLHEQGIAPIVPFATRLPRYGEIDGVDYRFVSPEAFDDIHARTPMFDVLQLKQNRYGTPLNDFHDALDTPGAVRTVNLAANSALGLREAMRAQGRTAVRSIFMLPASWSDIQRQMLEGGVSPEQVAQRCSQEPTDLTLLPEFNHIVINTFGESEATVRTIAAFAGRAALFDETYIEAAS